MTKTIISCDPGHKGALAALTADGQLIDVIDMPIFKINKKTYIDVRCIANFLDKYEPDLIVTEDVHSQSSDSKQSVFTFGYNTGALESSLAAWAKNRCQIEYLSPQRWKRSTGMIGKSKKAPTQRCIEIYGPDPFTGPRGGLLDGRGDAVMIGLATIKLNINGVRDE